jgi:ribosomal protein S6--L-glutamate ligase
MAHTLLRGARLEKCELTEAQRDAAVAAARLMGLEVCAVDILDVKGSPRVFEVNASPAITQLEQATSVDLASRIIDRAEALHREQHPPRRAKKGRPVREPARSPRAPDGRS